MTTPPHRRVPAALGRIVVALPASMAILAAPAVATEGNLYPQGPAPFTVGSMVSATQPSPAVVQLNAPATAAAPTGTHFTMGWGCPVPGSEIASVQWSALRYAAPSSAGLRVLANGHRVWGEGDAAMPQSPAGGRGYGLGLPAGTCDVRLELTQGERRQQHARVWWIGGTGAVIRDLAPPSAQVVSVPAGWVSADQGTTRIGWLATDNFGSDGIAGQRVQVAGETRWAGTPGQGQHAVDVPLAGLADGTHPVRVEVDGDGTGGTVVETTIRVDRTPPDVGEPGVQYPVGATGAAITFSATDATSGLANVTAEINAMHDGSANGPWMGVASLSGVGAGKSVTRATGGGLSDGVHAWRVTARDAAGNVGQQVAPEPLIVDTRPPRIDLQPIPSHWTSTLLLDVTLSDNLDQVIGLGDFEVEINTAGDASARGDWVPVAQHAAVPGYEAMQIPLTGMSDGVHVVRLRLRNGGPFAETLTATRMGLVRADLTPPDLTRAAIRLEADGTLKVVWSGEDARSGVQTARLQWLDGWTWRTVLQVPASDGSGIATVDGGLIPDRGARMRLELSDGAGNARAMEIEVPQGAQPAPVAPVPHMANQAREGTLTLTVTGGRPERVEGRDYRVVTLTAGQPATITGRLLSRIGQALGGFVVVARQGGQDIGAGVTGPNGSFRLQAVPLRTGPIEVGVPDGSTVVPVPTGPGAAVRLKATVTLMASSTHARAHGAPVVFRGTMHPAPGAVGGRKAIVLEWRDPFRGTWRPVVNARAAADGSFSIPWRFQARGLTVPFRIRVPRERGWLIEPGVSKVIRVHVR